MRSPWTAFIFNPPARAGLSSKPLKGNSPCWWRQFALTEITAGNLDIAVVGQLPVTNLTLCDKFEPGPIQVIGFEAPFRCRSLIEQGLEHAPTDTHDTFILAQADAELDRILAATPFPGENIEIDIDDPRKVERKPT